MDIRFELRTDSNYSLSRRHTMSETYQDPLIASTSDIKLVGLNSDKTRRMIGSETVYQVYFEMSGSPPAGMESTIWTGMESVECGPAVITARDEYRSSISCDTLPSSGNFQTLSCFEKDCCRDEYNVQAICVNRCKRTYGSRRSLEKWPKTHRRCRKVITLRVTARTSLSLIFLQKLF